MKKVKSTMYDLKDQSDVATNEQDRLVGKLEMTWAEKLWVEERDVDVRFPMMPRKSTLTTWLTFSVLTWT